jgi:hypothetical protein
MISKRTKNILFLIAGIAALVAAVAFYQFNKGPVDVKKASSIKVNAAELYQTYYKDSITATKTYSNKIVETTGTVAQVTNNQLNQSVVLLITNETGAFINCTVEDTLARFKEDETISIKGICTGIGMGDPDLGILGDVYLVRCYRTK